MVIVLVIAALLGVAGCSSSGSDGAAPVSLVVYSGRERREVEPIFTQFERESGIDLTVRYGGSPELATRLLDEGRASRADVFVAQDASSIGAVGSLLSRLPEDVRASINPDYQDAKRRWIGITGHVRTLAYNTDELSEPDLPDTVFAMTGPRWKGKLGIVPSSASFIGFISAIRQLEGDAAASDLLLRLADNDVRTYRTTTAVMDAIASGKIEAGLVDHHDLYRLRARTPAAPVSNHAFGGRDAGNLINVSAAGVLKSTTHRAEALKLLRYLIVEGQSYVFEDAPEREYPLSITFDTSQSERYRDLRPLRQISAPPVNLSTLGSDLQTTIEMVRQAKLDT